VSDHELPVTLSLTLLRQLEVLKLLTDDQLRTVLVASRLVRYPKRATVVVKGREIEYLGFLVSGKLQVVDYLPDGKEIGLNIIEAGQFFGELSVIDRQPRSASVVALTPVVVVQVPGEVARRMFYGYPPVAEAMMRHLALTVRRMSNLRSMQAMPNAFQRVFALLAYMQQDGPGDMQVIDDLPTHQEVAIMVNTSRETVTRAIAALRRAGVIEKDGRRLLIREPDRLWRMVEDPEQRPE